MIWNSMLEVGPTDGAADGVPRSGTFEQEGPERRALARHRYRNRVILCSPAAEGDGRFRDFLRSRAGSTRNLDLRLSRPVSPGQGLLLRVPASQAGTRGTLLAHVERAARDADGAWLVRCRLTWVPAQAQAVSASA
jgi:hypothetical protein